MVLPEPFTEIADDRSVEADFKAAFSRVVHRNVRVSIVPHGFHLSGVLPKLRGLADYAEGFGDEISPGR
jgi:hypothetical protein